VVFFNNTPALLIGLAAYTAFYLNRYREFVLFRARRPRRPVVAHEEPDRVDRPTSRDVNA
jgi:hypothetical protein